MPKTLASNRPGAVRKILHRYRLPDEFPLSPHEPTARWYKKLGGRRVYFGSLDDPGAALDAYHNHLHGRGPTRHRDGLTVRDALNAWLASKDRAVESGELRQSTFDDYKSAAEDIRDSLGAGTRVADLVPADFAKLRASWTRRFGPSELGKHIGYVRSAFKFCYESDLIDATPKYGPEFRKPRAKEQRKVRASKPKRLLPPDGIRRMLDDATVPMRAMILLALNCGWGNTDVAEAPIGAIDFDAGIVDWPRTKNSIERRAILWPETLAALREAIDARPAPRDKADRGLAFVTKYGYRWVRYREAGSARLRGKGENPVRGVVIDSIGLEFDKLLEAHKLKVPGVGFYALRHCFQTVADSTHDFPAIRRIMGHGADARDMSDRYRERIDDDRLRVVTDRVRAWLYGKGGAA